MEIGQRKVNARVYARKSVLLRTFSIFTYVNVRRQKRDSGNPPLESTQGSDESIQEVDGNMSRRRVLFSTLLSMSRHFLACFITEKSTVRAILFVKWMLFGLL